MFEAIAFAGGGNRCYWQGGFWEAAAPRLRFAPRLVTGASAGAWTACYTTLGIGRAVMESVAAGCETGVPNLDWRGALAGRRLFPVADLYRELMVRYLDDASTARLRAGHPQVLIALARRPRRLPLALAISLGLAIYQIEKKLFAPVHPRGGRWLGFRRDYVAVADLSNVEALIAALLASASVPPFMPVGSVGGQPALDGGLVDNVPVEPLEPVEAGGGRTLVLLTRRYANLPQIAGRTYVQPSRRIAISQFDVTDGQGIRDAYALGVEDGAAFADACQRG